VKASNTEAGDHFGISVSVSGDGNTLAAGAPHEASAATGVNNTSPGQADNTASSAGAVYVFIRASNAWSQQAYVKASNAEANDSFGTSVAFSSDGKTLAVGAIGESGGIPGTFAFGPTPGTDSDTKPNAGAVYVFARIPIGPGAWAQESYIKASNPDTSPGDGFGVCIALSADGNTLAVGSFEHSALTGIIPGSPGETATGNGAGGAGAVYMFKRATNLWSQQAYVKASNTNASDGFGATQLGDGSVALSGDGNTLAVGAQNEASSATGINGNQADNSAAGAGAVYLY
jgi:hypothetical protein